MNVFMFTPYQLPALNSGRYQDPLKKLISCFIYKFQSKSSGRYVESPFDPHHSVFFTIATD